MALSSDARAIARPLVPTLVPSLSDQFATAAPSVTEFSASSSSALTAASTALASGKSSQLPRNLPNLQRPRAVAVDISSDEQSSGEGSSDSSSSSSGSEAAALISQFHRTMTAAQSPSLLLSESTSSVSQAHTAADIVSKLATTQPLSGTSAIVAIASAGRATPPPPVPVRVKGLSSGKGSASVIGGGEGRLALSPRSAGRAEMGGMQRQKLRVGAVSISSGGASSNSLPSSARGATKNI